MAIPRRIGVLLMTYGSPATLEDVPRYLANVRGGRPAEPELVAEFQRRYALIGGSPLVQITREQAGALQDLLNLESDGSATYRVEIGMRFAAPTVREGVDRLALDSDEIVGIIMSPQYSPIIMGGYVRALEEAIAAQGRPNLRARVAGDWHLQPDFIAAIALRVTGALDRFSPDVRDRVPVLLTAHSMPKRVVETEHGYIDALKQTAAAVARRADLTDDRWMFCYQSAGHTSEEWLKPDFADIMPELRAQGRTHVLIAPVQFLADHLEILYDIEVGAREQAESQGIQFARTESLNVMPRFIQALASVVRDTLRAAPAAAPAQA